MAKRFKKKKEPVPDFKNKSEEFKKLWNMKLFVNSKKIKKISEVKKLKEKFSKNKLEKYKLSKRLLSTKKLFIVEYEFLNDTWLSKREGTWKFSKKIEFELENSKVVGNFIS